MIQPKLARNKLGWRAKMFVVTTKQDLKKRKILCSKILLSQNFLLVLKVCSSRVWWHFICNNYCHCKEMEFLRFFQILKESFIAWVISMCVCVCVCVCVCARASEWILCVRWTHEEENEMIKPRFPIWKAESFCKVEPILFYFYKRSRLVETRASR